MLPSNRTDIKKKDSSSSLYFQHDSYLPSSYEEEQSSSPSVLLSSPAPSASSFLRFIPSDQNTPSDTTCSSSLSFSTPLLLRPACDTPSTAPPRQLDNQNRYRYQSFFSASQKQTNNAEDDARRPMLRISRPQTPISTSSSSSLLCNLLETILRCRCFLNLCRFSKAKNEEGTSFSIPPPPIESADGKGVSGEGGDDLIEEGCSLLAPPRQEGEADLLLLQSGAAPNVVEGGRGALCCFSSSFASSSRSREGGASSSLTLSLPRRDFDRRRNMDELYEDDYEGGDSGCCRCGAGERWVVAFALFLVVATGVSFWKGFEILREMGML